MSINTECPNDGDAIMNQAALEEPDLSRMEKNALCVMLLICGDSSDASDRIFAKACRDELARRKD